MKLDLTLDLLSAAPKTVAQLAQGRDMEAALRDVCLDPRDRQTRMNIALFEAAFDMIATPREIACLADAVLGDGYAELRLTVRDGWPDFLAAITEAAAGRLHTIIARLPRHLGPEALRPLAVLAAEQDSPVALTGTVGTVEDYAWALDCAAEARLPLILDGTDISRNPRRIRCATLGDAEAEVLAEQGIGVELTDWRQAGRLYDRGVTLALGRGFTTMNPQNQVEHIADPEALLHDAFDWDDGVFADLDRKALAVAVCDDTTRHRLKEMTHAR